MLRLNSVSKRYGRGKWLLRDVDFVVPAGEVVSVAGDNGSGKSTLLRVLVGLSIPTSGTVSGRPDVVGYVPDRFPPNERLSAMAYLTHMGRIRGLRTDVAAARADLLVERLTLVGGKDAPLRTLSKGNAQKVVLAQALLVPPGLLVLDEPWSGLDASAHGVLGETIAEVARAGGSVVFTDHRESITGAHASRTYAVSGGKVTLRAVADGDGRVEPRLATEVVLTNPLGVTTPDWYAQAGVLEVAWRGADVTIRVTRDRSDALLLAALRLGCSVMSVEHGVTVHGNAR
ncbi:MAG: ATP-binding cassette domain-containing protein [Pseudonocardiaceae bacterium]